MKIPQLGSDTAHTVGRIDRDTVARLDLQVSQAFGCREAEVSDLLTIELLPALIMLVVVAHNGLAWVAYTELVGELRQVILRVWRCHWSVYTSVVGVGCPANSLTNLAYSSRLALYRWRGWSPAPYKDTTSPTDP